MKNLAVHIHYSHKNGLKEYEKHFLAALLVHYEVHLVSNSELDSKSIDWLTQNKISFLVRDNVGYDFGAYKDFFKNYGNKVRDYDNVLLVNNSFYGPIGNLEPPQTLLGNKDLFGWYLHPRTGCIKEHLQSFFLLFGPNIIKTNALTNFFLSLKYPTTFEDAIDIETSLTEYFRSKGFLIKYKSGFRETEQLFDNPSMLLPDKLLASGVPLLKRKCFYLSYHYFLENSYGHHPSSALRAAEKQGYPLNLIYDDLLDYQQSLTFPLLHHFYILDKDRTHIESDCKKIALIIFVYYEDLIEQNRKIIDRFLQLEAKVLIVSPKNEILELYQKNFSVSCEYSLMQNRGRNEFAYFNCGSEVLKKYDYTCLLHDKKSGLEYPAIRGYDWSEYCLDNLVPTTEYIQNVIEVFEKNPEIGLLFPPPPLFSKWRNIPNTVWANPNNFTWAKKLFELFELDVPFDTHPLVPYGAMFWVRKSALAPLVKQKLPLDFFPEEPLAADGTVLHALERIYTLIAQNEKFYSGWIMNKQSAEQYLINLYYELCDKVPTEPVAPGIKESVRMLFSAIKKRLNREYLRLCKKN